MPLKTLVFSSVLLCLSFSFALAQDDDYGFDLDDTEDITEEVREEAEEHQVFYEFSGVDVSYTSGQGDTLDSENNPLYINSLWSASASGSGTVTVYLIHEPVSKTSTDRNGFGGETDVQVDFPIVITN